MAEGNEFVMSYDRLRGVRVVGWWEPGDPRLHYRVEQEIPEGLLSHNLHLQSENKKGSFRKKNKLLVARIPHMMKQEWLKEINAEPNTLLSDTENTDVQKLLKRKLNSSEFQMLKTIDGSI